MAKAARGCHEVVNQEVKLEGQREESCPLPIVHNSRVVDRQGQGSNSNAHFNQLTPKEQEEIEAQDVAAI